MLPNNSTTTLAAAESGVQWMLARMRQDGSFQDASSLDGYYKAPIGLILF